MKENYLFKVLKQHPRLYVSIGIGLVVAFLGSHFGIQSRLTQAIVYILWAFPLMYLSTSNQMRKRALVQDDGKLVVLVLVVLALITLVASWLFTGR